MEPPPPPPPIFLCCPHFLIIRFNFEDTLLGPCTQDLLEGDNLYRQQSKLMLLKIVTPKLELFV